MNKLLKIIGCSIIIFLFFNRHVSAKYDPLTRENNRVGVHILDVSELDKAADLINSSGGDWGYVTIPIQETDRNREKWQTFFDRCKEKHIIPIIRIATTVNGSYWEKPNLYDSLDFANFLSDLSWPIENKYIIIYNEPNHAKEWGNVLSPEEYAKILKYTAIIFKKVDKDFFVLPAGLDAACGNTPKTIRLQEYLYRMHKEVPDVFSHIDGWTSHAYPNPAFSGSPNDTHFYSINSFKYELDIINQYTNKNLPIFITETGWKDTNLSQKQVAQYYQYAFENNWDNDQIVAITPFLLFAGSENFASFSLLDKGQNPKPAYQAIKNLNKKSGNPQLTKTKNINKKILGDQTENKGPIFEENFFNKQKKELKNILKNLWYTNFKGGE
jgi:hypothetical protein